MMSLLKAILPVEYQTKIIFTLLCVYVNVCAHVLKLDGFWKLVLSFHWVPEIKLRVVKFPQQMPLPTKPSC